jgi:hypothetical protein
MGALALFGGGDGGGLSLFGGGGGGNKGEINKLITKEMATMQTPAAEFLGVIDNINWARLKEADKDLLTAAITEVDAQIEIANQLKTLIPEYCGKVAQIAQAEAAASEAKIPHLKTLAEAAGKIAAVPASARGAMNEAYKSGYDSVANYSRKR